MANSRDRVLLVENDPVVSDLIGRQALQSAGYQVFVAGDAGTAISKALQWSPDLIITDLNLPGLSGKDLLAALAAQGVQTPVIILAPRGAEADVIQTFRLGAADYLLLPAREAEVIAAVERVMRQGHDRRERDRLAQQLQQANQELQARVRELTTIFAIGKMVTSVTDPAALLDKILDAAVHITQADLGWFLLREDAERPFVVAAQRNLPPALGVTLNQPWDDGISSLVAMSGETLSIHGEPLKRSRIYGVGQSALITPIKVQQKKVIGLLVMMRRAAAAFGPSEQHLLDALADFASIAIVNARLLRAAEERVRAHQQGRREDGGERLEAVQGAMAPALAAAREALEKLSKDPTARWRPDQRQLLATIQDQLKALEQAVSARGGLSSAVSPRSALGDQARVVVQKLQPLIRQNNLVLAGELPTEPIVVCVESGLVARMLEGMLNAVFRYSSQGARVGLRVSKQGKQAQVAVRTSSLKVEPKELEKLLQPQSAAGGGGPLSVVKEAAVRVGGNFWIESEPGKETAFYLTLPLDL